MIEAAKAVDVIQMARFCPGVYESWKASCRRDRGLVFDVALAVDLKAATLATAKKTRMYLSFNIRSRICEVLGED